MIKQIVRLPYPTGIPLLEKVFLKAIMVMALFTALSPDGIIKFSHLGPLMTSGQIDTDGMLSIKSPWWRGEGVSGELTIEGKRIDSNLTSSLVVSIPEGYDDWISAYGYNVSI